jgi:toxin ParE1/3/4
MNSIHFSADANVDIAEIGDYLFKLDPAAAYRFLNRLDEVFELLASHHHLGRLRPDFGENVRSFPVANYLVFYTPFLDGITVVRVIYGGRDLPEIM